MSVQLYLCQVETGKYLFKYLFGRYLQLSTEEDKSLAFLNSMFLFHLPALQDQVRLSRDTEAPGFVT